MERWWVYGGIAYVAVGVVQSCVHSARGIVAEAERVVSIIDDEVRGGASSEDVYLAAKKRIEFCFTFHNVMGMLMWGLIMSPLWPVLFVTRMLSRGWWNKMVKDERWEKG
jgi:hypothetical protein